ncbi:MAG TPA: hypothetical protein VJT08_14775 [Terriglobales bacterium]|nr:hypothetical protein [Terriglobales bacterium]
MAKLKVADAVWIAAALLQRAKGRDADFSLSEILDKAKAEKLEGADRPGMRAHVAAHAVADLPPNPGNYRMLHAAGRGRRRLFRNGDPAHSARTGKTHPNVNEIPDRYRPLIDWYEHDYNRSPPTSNIIQSEATMPLTGRGTSGAVLLRFWGIMPPERAQEFQRIVEEGCERIEP